MGAGPAGLSAAIHLARNGFPVVVYEKNAAAGSRFHNDFQGLENWSSEGDIMDRLRMMSVDVSFFCKPIREGIVHGPSDRAHIRSAMPLFYLIKRGKDADSLDNALRKQALDLGVKIVYNTAASAVDCDIIATGPKRPRIFALGQVFRTDSDDVVIAILNDAIVPHGYAYLIISGGKATLAVIHFGGVQNIGRSLDAAVAKFGERHDLGMRDPRTFSGFGGFDPPATAVADGKLRVGEAAGFQDFLFGFGTRYALLSGHFAARSIIEGTDYDGLWRKEFGRQLIASRRNRRIYELFGSFATNAFVRHLQTTDDPKRLLFLCYNRSLFRLLFR